MLGFAFDPLAGERPPLSAGRWAFLEVSDPWDAEHLIRDHLVATAVESAQAVS
jgi:hypothetical protein